MELNVKSAGLAAGATAAAVYVVCIAAFWVVPDLAVSVGGLVFHGIVTKPQSIEPTGAVAGLVLVSIASALIVGLFVVLYNKWTGD